uniref:Uncharacterized protein n=1 Tax=Phaeomonas parva TaxID=124430 RepID=A0A6U4H7B9_9STRA|mmetsp:Transcript_29322/g.94007  ORF Transcript_29322/g.94007 Transcript_29322/m.94007 type:complete len:130 (+) Transcript_29322:173-562(+)|eukprot:CAMPEP_0118867528 /NCGR_PEP_ID=MMETSP1163-20130328/11107_1 /TAXON_ID=124430 /ORGANISM="Phaeomonas parva, Strain CCMP2877" /LENGTH=129 /DNA_ID=CAMNT_0006801947 /DNA_START=148 /DNA_END=537 /DNA_ORIENTATION=+
MAAAEARGMLRTLLRHVRRMPSVKEEGCLDMIRTQVRQGYGLQGAEAAARLATLRDTVTLLDTVEQRRIYARMDSGDKVDEAEKVRLSARRAGLQLPQGVEEGKPAPSNKLEGYEDKMSGFLAKSLFKQ